MVESSVTFTSLKSQCPFGIDSGATANNVCNTSIWKYNNCFNDFLIIFKKMSHNAVPSKAAKKRFIIRV